jgi:hypothetical protein
MKIAAADFPRLRLSLLAALLMMAIGAAGVYLTLGATRVAKLDQAAAQKQRNEIDGKLKRVRSEEAEIKQKSALFNALLARGVIGEEQRLEWVELLKAIGDRRRLIDLQYEIAPQRPLDAADTTSAFAFYASAMKVQLKLLHEEDLTRLLDDLRQQAGALIQIRSCSLSRLPRSGGESDRSAQLQADCLIDWITLRETASVGGTGR